MPNFIPAALLALIVTSVGTAAPIPQSTATEGSQEVNKEQAGKPETTAQIASASPWLITVMHQINILELQRSLAQRGVKMSGEISNLRPINVTTGIVIDSNGHVLTRLVNLNPEAGENGIGTISVLLPSGETRPARFIGLDGPTGFCLLSVEGLAVEPARLTGRPNVEPGMPVTLVNVQFKTFTVQSANQPKLSGRQLHEKIGMIAAPCNRAIFSVGFDGGVNMAYSPNMGVVVDNKNEVIGIPETMQNNILQVFSAFEAQRAASRILARGGNVPRAWLGVVGRDLSVVAPETLATLSVTKGVIIDYVVPDSPATLANLREGDVISMFNGEAVESREQLFSFVAMQPAGENVEFGIWRDNKLQKINVTLGERGYANFYVQDKVEERAHQYFLEQELGSIQRLLAGLQKLYDKLRAEGAENTEKVKLELKTLQARIAELLARKNQLMFKMRLHGPGVLVNSAADKTWLGVETADLPYVPSKSLLTPRPRGVRVTNVVADSMAARAGIKPDDVITQIAGYLVPSRVTLINILSLLQRAHLDSCEVIVKRGTDTVSLKLNLTQPDKVAPKAETTPLEQ